MAKKSKTKDFIPNPKNSQQNFNTKAKGSDKSSRSFTRRAQ